MYPPRNCNTMCTVEPAATLNSCKVFSSDNCLPIYINLYKVQNHIQDINILLELKTYSSIYRKIYLIWSTWIPSFSCKACLTSNTDWVASKLKGFFLPERVYNKVHQNTLQFDEKSEVKKKIKQLNLQTLINICILIYVVFTKISCYTNYTPNLFNRYGFIKYYWINLWWRLTHSCFWN